MASGAGAGRRPTGRRTRRATCSACVVTSPSMTRDRRLGGQAKSVGRLHVSVDTSVDGTSMGPQQFGRTAMRGGRALVGRFSARKMPFRASQSAVLLFGGISRGLGTQASAGSSGTQRHLRPGKTVRSWWFAVILGAILPGAPTRSWALTMTTSARLPKAGSLMIGNMASTSMPGMPTATGR
jgi:hypothetical protein